ncbi:TPA: hypothetical protein ACH3X2_14318 [Trebouxia sp. C0005]
MPPAHQWYRLQLPSPKAAEPPAVAASAADAVLDAVAAGLTSAPWGSARGSSMLAKRQTLLSPGELCLWSWVAWKQPTWPQLPASSQPLIAPTLASAKGVGGRSNRLGPMGAWWQKI